MNKKFIQFMVLGGLCCSSFSITNEAWANQQIPADMVVGKVCGDTCVLIDGKGVGPDKIECAKCNEFAESGAWVRTYSHTVIVPQGQRCMQLRLVPPASKNLNDPYELICSASIKK